MGEKDGAVGLRLSPTAPSVTITVFLGTSRMTKSALGIDPADYGVFDPVHAWRIRKAQREAERRDSVFLRKNPDRRFYLRPSMPFEQDGWMAREHLDFPLMLVRLMPETNQFHRLAIKGDQSTVLPSEEFCRLLYFRVCPNSEDGSGAGSLTAIAHAELLEEAGVKVIRREEQPHG